jgi:hypothetical protein
LDRNDYIEKLAYLTDNINKKVRKFRNEGLDKFYENKLNYVTAKYDRKIGLTMESGFLTKSKKEIGKLSDRELKDLYDRLHKFQTNQEYGTVKRFKVTESVQLSKTASTLRDLIGEEEYLLLKGNKTEVEFVKEFIKRKEEFTNSRGRTYVSNQIMNEWLLESGQLTEQQKQDSLRAVEKMKRANELLARNTSEMEGRRKNGNR